MPGGAAISYETFLAIAVAGQAVSIGLMAFIVFVFVAFGVGVWQSRVSSGVGLESVYSPETGWHARRVLEWFGAPLIVSGLLFLNIRATELLAERWELVLPSLGNAPFLTGLVDTILPAASSVLSVSMSFFWVMALLGIAVYMINLIRSRWIAAGLFLGIVLLPMGTVLSIGTPWETGLLIGGSLLVTLIILLGWIWLVLRGNFAAYLVGVGELSLANGAINLLTQPDEWVSGNGLALLVILVLAAFLSAPLWYRLTQNRI